jgi:hypothetical protein
MLTPLGFVSNKNNTMDPSVWLSEKGDFESEKTVSHSLVSMSK